MSPPGNKTCRVCRRTLPPTSYAGNVNTCTTCRGGLQRFASMARHRPHMFDIDGPARACMVAWYAAHQALKRAFDAAAKRSPKESA